MDAPEEQEYAARVELGLPPARQAGIGRGGHGVVRDDMAALGGQACLRNIADFLLGQHMQGSRPRQEPPLIQP